MVTKQIKAIDELMEIRIVYRMFKTLALALVVQALVTLFAAGGMYQAVKANHDAVMELQQLHPRILRGSTP